MRRALGLGLAMACVIGCGGPQGPVLTPGACSPLPEGEEPPWEGRGYALPVPWFAPRRGAQRPRVVIQEFSDFECPYCARALPTVDDLLAEFGDCVQVVWRQRPLRYHAHADDAARASVEVYRQGGDEAFWRYHDRLFADQEDLSRPALLAHARALGGIDVDAVERVLESDDHAAVIARDRGAIDRLGLELGTPSFFVNGVLLHGARRISHFRRAIIDALNEQARGSGASTGGES
ncbi:MAG: DsbA family protein [Sandaracinaceae bacterium]